MHDPSSLVDPASPPAGLVCLEEAIGISVEGWIAANGTDSRDPGRTRALIAIPL